MCVLYFGCNLLMIFIPNNVTGDSVTDCDIVIRPSIEIEFILLIHGIKILSGLIDVIMM